MNEAEIQQKARPRRGAVLVAGAAVAGLAVWGGVAVLSDDDPNLDPAVVAFQGECTAEGAVGSVTNNDGDDVTAVVEVSFLDIDGVFIHKASATRPGIAPGASEDFELEFDASLAPDDVGEYTDCEISVPSVFRFNR